MPFDWNQNINDYQTLKEAEKAIYSEMNIENKKYNIDRIHLSYAYKDLLFYFSIISKRTKNHPYLFILLLTQFEESVGHDQEATSLEILDDYITKSNTFVTYDIAGVAFYYLGLVAYRSNDLRYLKKVLLEYGSYFENDTYYKMYLYELYGRYCLLNKDFMNQLKFDQAMKDASIEAEIFEKNVAINAGVGAAASTIAEYYFYNQIQDSNIEDSKKNEITNINELKKVIFDTKEFEFNLSKKELMELIERGFILAKEAIEFNPNYHTYYILAAKLLFYQSLFNDGKFSKKEQQAVYKYIDLAIGSIKPENKNYDSLMQNFKRFYSMVEACPTNNKKWTSMPGFKYEAMKNQIMNATDSKLVQPDSFEVGSKAPHVFISYSSKDFKTVYCDIIELTRKGVLCDYDKNMDSLVGSDIQAWYQVIEQKIKDASCIVCFLSKDYMVSNAVLEELKYAEKYQKKIVAVDLTGQRKSSSILVSIAQDSRYSCFISSDILLQHSKMFDDNNNVISRSKDSLNNTHIDILKNRIFSLCPEIRVSVKGMMATLIGRHTNHPMEDYALCDNEYGLYIVTDGITRGNKEEYIDNTSKVYELAESFSNKFKEYYIEHLYEVNNSSDVETLLQECFKVSNKYILPMVEEYQKLHQKENEFFEPLGCVGVVAAIYRDYLYFASIGDCMGILVRNNKKTIFADKQTTFAFKKVGVEGNRELLYSKFVNHPENPSGYGVINGNDNAISFFNVSRIKLEYGDQIYLASDGISDYIQYNNPLEYNQMDLVSVLNEAVKVEEAILGTDCKHDDMSLIRISFNCESVE